MTPEPTKPAKRRRWRWRIAWWVFLAVLAGCGYQAWRWYDFRSAVKEAQALGWEWTYDDPFDAIRNDWTAAFRGATWSEGKRDLDIHTAIDVERHSRLLHRLAPRSLNIERASGLKDLSMLDGFSGLQGLALYDCAGLRNLDGIKGHMGLQSLWLIRCTGEIDLGPLAKLPALRELSLFNSTGVKELGPLAKLPALQVLNLAYCTRVTELGPLAQLPALETLFLIGCTDLQAGEVEKLRAALPKCFISISGP